MTNFREIATAVGLAVIIVAGAFFYHGWLRWQNRPPQTVNNIQQISGDNATVSQTPERVTQQHRVFTGLYGNQREVGAVVGWLW